MDSPRRQTFLEYAETLDSSAQGAAISNALNAAVAALSLAQSANMKPPLDFDQLFVIETEDIVADNLAGEVIRLSTGLLYSLCRLPTANTKDLYPDECADLKLDLTEQVMIALVWIVGHEYFHGHRRHNDIADVTQSSKESMHAMEFDADLVAAHLTFDYLVWLSNGTRDRAEIRKLVYFYVHHTLTSFASTLSSATHPRHEVRLLAIQGKLAQIPDPGDGGPLWDRELGSAECSARLQYLGTILAACFLATGLSTDIHGATDEVCQITNEWDRLNPVLQEKLALNVKIEPRKILVIPNEDLPGR